MQLIQDPVQPIQCKGTLSRFLTILYAFLEANRERFTQYQGMTMDGSESRQFEKDALGYVMRNGKGLNPKLVQEWINLEIGTQC